MFTWVAIELPHTSIVAQVVLFVNSYTIFYRGKLQNWQTLAGRHDWKRW